MLNQSVRKIINVDSANLVPLYTFKQEDDAVLLLSLFRNSVPLDITGQTVTLGIKRPNGTLVNLETLEGDNPFTIDSNNLDIKLKNSVLAIPGLLECDLELVDVNGKMTTASFYITVNRKVVGDTNVQATNEIFILNKIKLEEEARETNETNRKESEIARVSAEELREQRETIRGKNETTREESESIRSDQETIRKNNEITREEQESSRALNESQRTENENARALKEEERVNSENTRNSNEETRKSTETSRIEAEKVRASEEDTRKSNEVTRVNNESNRQTKEQERASAEETRKTNELARQGAYKEITDARKDFNGVVRDNLNERLSYDLGYINDRFNNASLLEYDSKYISASKSYDGVTRDLKIKGRTLQNLVSIEKTKYLDITNGVIIQNGTIQAFGNSAYNNFFLKKGDLFKPSTKYTIIVNVIENTLNGNCYITSDDALSSSIFGNEFTIAPGIVGTIKKLSTTKADISTKTMSLRSFISNLSTTGSITLKYMILEGDYTNEDIPCFEGIKSVGEEGKLDVVSCGKNLVKNRYVADMKHASGRYVTSDMGGHASPLSIIYLKNGKYNLSIEGISSIASTFVDASIYIWKTDKNVNNCRKVSINSNFEIKDGEIGITWYGGLAFENTEGVSKLIGKSVQIEKNTVATTYELYKEVRIPITLNAPLRNLPNGTCDEVDLENGKIIRRVKKIIMDGINNLDYSIEKNLNDKYILIKYIPTGDITVTSFICDKLVAYTGSIYPNDFEGSYIVSGIKIKLLSSKLETLDVNGAIKYLKANPITIYYQLATPIEEDIVLPNNLRTYDGITNIFTEGSLIEPNVYSKISSNVQAVVSSLREDNYSLNNEVATLSLENENLKEGHKVQSIQIEDSETAINFLLMESMSNISVMKIESNEMEVRSMESYFAKQIYKGALEYDAVIAKYPQYKEGIDKLLKEYVENDGIIYSNNVK